MNRISQRDPVVEFHRRIRASPITTIATAINPSEPVGSVGIAAGGSATIAVPDMLMANVSLSMPMVVLLDLAPGVVG
jgi:hypothetical protein